MQLDAQQVTVMLPVRDLTRARDFYERALALPSGEERRSSIAELEGRGVVFADYDLPGFKTVEHVCVLGSEKAAWFSDPEGNILCLHEDIPGSTA